MKLTKAEKQYLETALWSSTDPDGTPLDKEFGIPDFSKNALKQARAELEAFLLQAEEPILVFGDKMEEQGKTLDFDDSDLAHDFWLTRNGHGVGFWDRPEKYGEDLAEVLSEIAAGAGERRVEEYSGRLEFEPDQRSIDLDHPQFGDPSDIIKRCGCGRQYTDAEWKKLQKVGEQHTAADEFGPEELLELRNCPCKSTLAVEIQP